MASTTTTLDAILKDRYEGPMGDAINKSHPLLEKLKPREHKWSGRKLVYSVALGRNMSPRSHAENTALPVAGSAAVDDTAIYAKKISGRMSLTEDLINAANGGDASFVPALKFELDQLTESCSHELSRQLYGNKLLVSSAYPTGILTQVNGTVNDATIVVDDNRWLEVGKTYRIGTTAELASTTSATGTVLSKSGTTGVTFTAAVDVVDNDYIVQGDSLGNSYDAEISGLEFMVDDANDNFEGINTGTYTNWKSTVIGNSGTARALTLELMAVTYDTIQNTSGYEPDFILMHNSARRRYVTLLQSDVRFDAGKFEGGWSKLSFSNGSRPTQVETDVSCTYGKIYMLNSKELELAARTPWKFLDRAGAVLRQVENYDTWEATYTWAGQLTTRNRNRHGVLEDLTVSQTA